MQGPYQPPHEAACFVQLGVATSGPRFAMMEDELMKSLYTCPLLQQAIG